MAAVTDILSEKPVAHARLHAAACPVSRNAHLREGRAEEFRDAHLDQYPSDEFWSERTGSAPQEAALEVLRRDDSGRPPADVAVRRAG